MQSFCKVPEPHINQLQSFCKIKILENDTKPPTFVVEIIRVTFFDFEIAVTILNQSSVMKRIAAVLTLMLLTLLNATGAMAQTKVDDKEIIGVWIMTSMKFQGENEELVNGSYSQVKVYRANGEYACAEIVKLKDGSYYVAPHEYGTYTMKNGMYSEMGRKAIKFTFIDKEHFGGRWKNRIDSWKKVKNIPEELTQHIVDKCKANEPSSKHLQQMMKQYILSK